MNSGTVRIISGQWRGRKLKFPAIPGLRPTPDRVRETVFNWLAPVIHNAQCLDLFAGSGALGLEALSRGAKHIVFVDQSPQVVKYLQEQLKLLQTTNHAEAYCATINPPRQILPIKRISNDRFNIVFLDPPFHKNLISACCEWLEQEDLLAPDAYIYIEAESELNPLPIPANWQILKSKIAGQVGYHLVQKISGLTKNDAMQGKNS